MTATLTHVGKQFQQDWTGQLEPEAILTACHGAAYRWRERTLGFCRKFSFGTHLGYDLPLR